MDGSPFIEAVIGIKREFSVVVVESHIRGTVPFQGRLNTWQREAFQRKSRDYRVGFGPLLDRHYLVRSYTKQLALSVGQIHIAAGHRSSGKHHVIDSGTAVLYHNHRAVGLTGYMPYHVIDDIMVGL